MKYIILVRPKAGNTVTIPGVTGRSYRTLSDAKAAARQFHLLDVLYEIYAVYQDSLGYEDTVKLVSVGTPPDRDWKWVDSQ